MPILSFRAKTPASLRAPVCVAVVLALLASAAPVAAAESSLATLPPLGMSVSDISALKAAGAPPRYASYWVGDWMAKSGWGGFDSAMKSAKAAGVTPVVYWYYWGDSISPSCFDADGCGSRNEAQWSTLTDQLIAHLKSTLGGSEVLIVLENEFNKGGITGDFAPTFDAKLEKVALRLKAVPNAKLILGFGAWAEASWTKFPKSAAASDYIGFQMMRASTRDTEASYRGAADRTAYLTGYIASKFQKPSFLYDVALSSYPDAKWEKIQAETLDAIFGKLVASGSTGLQGVVYRSLNDHYMDPKNYYGDAESHWGLRTKSGVPKAAFGVWLEHARGAPSSPPPPPPPASPNVPGSFEAESMSATKGGRKADPSASGGASWNLWSNGELSTTLVAAQKGLVRIEVRASGQSAGGVHARMEVRLDGVALAAWSVPPGAYAPYAVDATLPAGSSRLAVAFTNDAVVGGEDRNLLVDVVHVGAAPKPNRAPVAAFDAASTHLAASFDASASSDPDGDALTYAWSFGDGAGGTGKATKHTYAEPGTYRVTLTVDDGRASAVASRTISVAYPAPVARFEVSGDGRDRTFDAAGSHDPAGGWLSYAWSFGDGGSGEGVRVSHAYAAGDYTATLTVTNRFGEKAIASARVVVASEPYSASFAPRHGNGWWVQVRVDASGPTTEVCATIDDGPCQPLMLRSWGDWAAAMKVPDGSRLTYTATSAGGERATSPTFRGSSAEPWVEPFTASFAPYDGNSWWIQTRVDASKPLASVCASVDGGSCRPLALKSWGSWAASHYARTGAKVVFKATSTTGETATSPVFTWPVK